MRTTRKDIYNMQDRINEVLERKNTDFRVSVEWAYGQPRAHTCPADNLYRSRSDLSPRLPMGKLYRWLYAYYLGLTATNN